MNVRFFLFAESAHGSRHWLFLPLLLACDPITIENKEEKKTPSRSLRAGVRKPTECARVITSQLDAIERQPAESCPHAETGRSCCLEGRRKKGGGSVRLRMRRGRQFGQLSWGHVSRRFAPGNLGRHLGSRVEPGRNIEAELQRFSTFLFTALFSRYRRYASPQILALGNNTLEAERV